MNLFDFESPDILQKIIENESKSWWIWMRAELLQSSYSWIQFCCKHIPSLSIACKSAFFGHLGILLEWNLAFLAILKSQKLVKMIIIQYEFYDYILVLEFWIHW